MRAARLSLVVTGVSTLLLVTVYAVAFGTARGRSFDEAALRATPNGAVRELSVGIVDTVPGLVTLALVAALALALAPRARERALAAVLLLAGANLTTGMLKPLLGALDPFGGEAGRRLHDGFPSGHTTAAASVGLALVLVAPPALRTLAALAGGGFALAVGLAPVAIDSHFPSDVAGGFLVAGAWSGVAAGWLCARRRCADPARPALAAVVAASALVLAAVTLAASERPLVRTAAGLATITAAVFLSASLLRRPVYPPRSRG